MYYILYSYSSRSCLFLLWYKEHLIQRMGNVCVNPVSLLQFILLLVKHTIFRSKLTEIVDVEIPMNPGRKRCNYRGVCIFYKINKIITFEVSNVIGIF